MLLNKEDNRELRKKILLPQQDRAPSFSQIEKMLADSKANPGRMVELPFGVRPATFSLTCQNATHWMLYRSEEGKSTLEWDYNSTDIYMIHNAICAQFPDADLNPVAAAVTVAKAPEITFAQPPATTTAQSGKAASAAEPASTVKPVMEGDLQKLQLPNLLQSIAMGKMSGRLEIKNVGDVANLFFADGSLVHCVTRNGEGDTAALELLGIQGGTYRFFQEPVPEKQTVKRRLDALLVEGAALVDQSKYLDQLGLTQESYLHRMHSTITESAFEQAVGSGAGRADMNFQKMIYQAIDGKSQLVEILRRYPLPKRDWVPVIYNLHSCQLISFKNEAPEQLKSNQVRAGVEPTAIDWSLVRGAEKSLIRSDSGLMSYPAFLGFLEREMARFEVFKHPLTLLVLEMKLNRGTGLEPLPLNGLQEAVKRIEKLKRKTDIVAHYEMFSLALILPETNSASTRTFVPPLMAALAQPPLIEGVEPEQISISVGLACVPDDCSQIEYLLSQARPRPGA